MSRGRAALAVLLSFLLVVAGALTSTPAMAASSPTLSVSKTAGLNPAGETVTVSGSGFSGTQAMYLTTCTDVPLSDVSFTFIAAGCTTGSRVVTPTPREGNPAYVQLNADGTFTATLTVTPKSGSTAIYTIADHTAMDDRSQDAKQAIAFATVPTVTQQPAAASVQEGATATFTAAAGGDPSPSVRWQRSTNGIDWSDIEGATAASYTTGALVLSDSGASFRAVFTNTAGSVETAAATLTVTAAPAPVAVPTLSVSKTTGLDPAGETVTVTGSGFSGTQAMYLTTCTDVPLSDVSFSFISSGCTTGSKVVTPNPRAGNPAYVQLNADGTFETTLTVTPKSGSTAIYTIADHTGMNNRTQDAKQTITFRSIPTLSVSKTTGLNPAGETVTVSGSGFSGTQAMYLTTCTDVPLSDVSFTFISAGCTTGSKVVTPNPRAGNPAYVQLNADGTFETTLTVAPKSGSTAIYTIADHTAMNDRSQDAKQAITFRSPTLSVSKTTDLDPAGETVTVSGSGFDPAVAMYLTTCTDVPLSDVSFDFINNGCTSGAKLINPNPSRSSQVKLNEDGTFETTLTVTPKSGSTAIYTIADHSSQSNRSQDAKQTIAFRSVPTLSVSKTTGLDPAGEAVTVTGSGFSGTQPMYLTTCTDVPLSDVSFTFISAGCTTGAKVVTPNPRAGNPAYVQLNADGTFETTLPVAPKSGSTAIYTIADHTAMNDRSQDAKQTITFAEKPSAVATVTAASGLTGLAVKVDGSNLGGITGAYVALIEKGTESSVTSDSGFAAMTYAMGITAGSFTTTLAAAPGKLDRAKQYEVIVWQQHTTPNSANIYARTDVTVTTEQWDQVFPGTTPPVTPPVTPTQPEQPQTVAGGSLSWAISRAFTSYITGPIAHGSIAVSGGATSSGGAFQFGQAAGSTFDGSTGTVSYVGSVRFTGHNGILDVTVANPQIRFTSSGSASLYVTSGGRQVEFATLGISAGARSESNGATTFSNVPATLTSAGLNQVLNGYSTALDPITFTIGAAAAAPGGSTGTIATAAAVTPARAIPSAPPATTGIEVDQPTLAALGAGAQTTITVSGFQPYEKDIAIVVYSTPILLGTVDADANGVATWIGVLPATLEDGEHTLTFQGSVSRGIQFTLARAAAASPIGQCTVEGATLKWGFKESFRSYIEGIAHGGWELADIVYEYPDYVWSNGSGALNTEDGTGLVDFGGALTFTGHEGVLNTTLSNARLELAGDTGYIVFDISGTTQTGEAVSATDVRFAEFALPELEVLDGSITLDALPATLTDAGSAAFGTYGPGEEMDAVSAVIPVDADCDVVPVLANDEVQVEAAPISAEVEEAGVPVWVWIVGVLVILAIAIIILAVVLRRRRANS